MKPYNQIIKELREDRDIKQKEVAEYLNITKQQYSLYETGKRDFKVSHIKDIAIFYNVSADYILGLPDLPYPKR